MSAKVSKAGRRDIRRAFGAEFQEAVETFMLAHEAGLKQHGDILNHILYGPCWRRWVWLLCGARVVFWLFPPKGGTHGE